MDGQPIEILLVEDDIKHIHLTQTILRDSKLHNRLTVVNNGVHALNFLRKAGQYAAVTLPDVVLLNLNLPLKDGWSVLKEMQQDESLRYIPVVVMAASEDEARVLRRYHPQTLCALIKPLNFTGLVSVVKRFDTFRFQIVKLADAETERDA
jgi:CheY-like chemotaxis protein